MMYPVFKDTWLRRLFGGAFGAALGQRQAQLMQEAALSQARHEREMFTRLWLSSRRATNHNQDTDDAR